MKNDLMENKIKEEKIVQCDVRQAFFHQVNPGLEAFPMFCKGDWWIFSIRGRFTGIHWIYIGNSSLLEMLRSLNTLWR